MWITELGMLGSTMPGATLIRRHEASTGVPNMRAAVTGGAGFIGHHLVGGLVAKGHHVNVIDDLSSGRRARLARFSDQIAMTEASILDSSALDRTFSDCDVIFHEAAIASVAKSLVAPGMTNEVNVSGTIEVMLSAARCGVPRVVFAGSSAVYGAPDELPCSESQLPAPLSPYGVSKLAAEHYVHSLGRLHHIETAVLRYFNVYGPGQDPAAEYAAVVPRFVTAVLNDQAPIINGSDEITRDFVHVDDVVEANLLAAQVPTLSSLTCNIASGSRTSLRELLRAVSAAVGRHVEPTLGPPRDGDIRHSEADISLAQLALGYAVRVQLGAGLNGTVEWFRRSGLSEDAAGS
jgi:nucleoside-diphosphate-sugar epimerase